MSFKGCLKMEKNRIFLFFFLNEADIKWLGFKKSEATNDEEEKRGDVYKITKTKKNKTSLGNKIKQ